MGGIILRRTNELPSINLCQLGNKGLKLGYHSVTALGAILWQNRRQCVYGHVADREMSDDLKK
jgi:hypothetical protein